MLRTLPAVLLITATLLLGGCDVPIIAAPPTPAPTAPAATPVPLPPGAADRLARYVEGTRTLLAEIDGDAPVDALRETTNDLLDQSLKLLPDYLDLYPHCESYLAATLEIALIWDSLSPSDIRRDYLDQGILPTSPRTPNCEPMKDLIVRPAMMLSLQDQPDVDRGGLRAEIATLGARAETVTLRPEPTTTPGG